MALSEKEKRVEKKTRLDTARVIKFEEKDEEKEEEEEEEEEEEDI